MYHAALFVPCNMPAGIPEPVRLCLQCWWRLRV
jgi:hypothetical protein